MSYRIDWIQFLAAIAMLVTYVVTIALCAIGAWPRASIASALATFAAFGVWLYRHDANGSQQ
mgnify:CR=1 FL=1|jgi:hypothetical protein|nr:MAG TPA: Membrane fusion protein p14 fusion protein transmembrane domain [Caudoviricetes sp.]